jgi:hypothetical protein
MMPIRPDPASLYHTVLYSKNLTDSVACRRGGLPIIRGEAQGDRQQEDRVRDLVRPAVRLGRPYPLPARGGCRRQARTR